jgi:DNA-binding CsgD family transcriptional regulator
VDALHSAIIDFTEAAYNLEAEHEVWLPKLIEAGAPVLRHGLGVFAMTCVRPLTPGPLDIDQLYVASGPADFPERLARLRDELDTRFLWPLSRPGAPKTLSEVTRDHDPAAFDLIMHYFGFAKDALALAAFDPNGRGVYLIIALPEVTRLSVRARERWQMLAAHFAAGYRLRQKLRANPPAPSATTSLPLRAEAVIDPIRFRVVDAEGEAQSREALAALRRAAKQVDCARGRLRRSDPEKALELWRALVRGRWAAVDWFDSDGRRYVLGIPNAPHTTDPRGLTDRETQVASYAHLGLSNKMIAYHLGVSKGRVSTLIGSAMRKLGVHTRPQLVKKLSDFPSLAGA